MELVLFLRIMNKVKIGNVEINYPLILAPMAGITNLSYRKMMKELGCPLTVSEMVSDFALHYGNKETIKMIDTSEIDHPLSIQLFGGSKESLLNGAKVLFKLGGFDILDINLGCPVNKVVKEKAGSSWLKEERKEELYEAIKSLVDISPVPVTCKIRLGWDENSINVVSTCKTLEKAGVKMIAIHARTRSMMYSGDPKYEYIKLAKEAVKIPIFANGDINSIEKVKEILEYTKCDGVMIGRGALGNPILIKQIVEMFSCLPISKDSTLSQRVDFMIIHFNYLMELKGEFKAISEMRGLSTHYLKGFNGMKKFKLKLISMKSKEEFYQIAMEIKNYN